jgi:hypothetical protein
MTLLGEPNLLSSTPYGGVDGATPKISTLKLQVSRGLWLAMTIQTVTSDKFGRVRSLPTIALRGVRRGDLNRKPTACLRVDSYPDGSRLRALRALPLSPFPRSVFTALRRDENGAARWLSPHSRLHVAHAPKKFVAFFIRWGHKTLPRSTYTATHARPPLSRQSLRPSLRQGSNNGPEFLPGRCF